MSGLRAARRKQDVDMTQGSILRHLITFSLPLLAGNVFQQMYNMVDTWVVGNYVGNEAFSAVGSVGPIINMLIGFFMGLSSGAGAVISQFYGAKQHDRVRNTVHTAVLMTLILGVLFTGIGVFMTPYMLNLTNTPPDVLPEASRYLIIYFSGILGLMLYNIGAGILRAVGNSRYPFYFLVVAALLNTGLDLLFVLVFDMDVAGVALATVLAQGVSAILVMILLLRSQDCIRLRISKLRIHFDMLKKVLTVGIPTALQMAITAFSNVFVQSYINHFGKDFMSGWTAYAKIDQLMFLPMQSISLAGTTFVGQNLGANQPERAKKGVSVAMKVALSCTIILLIPLMLFAPDLVEFFNNTPKVVEFGTLLLRLISPFYLLCCITQIYVSALRGAGNTKTPTLIVLGSYVVFRQIYLFVTANYISNTVIPIAMSYPAGWILCTTLLTIYYHRTKLMRTQLVKSSADR